MKGGGPPADDGRAGPRGPKGRSLPTCIAHRPSANIDTYTPVRRPAMSAASQPSYSQLSYSHGASAQALLGETIGANLRRITAAHADNEALVDIPSGRRWTDSELDSHSDAGALGLHAAGVLTGAPGRVWAPDCAHGALGP